LLSTLQINDNYNILYKKYKDIYDSNKDFQALCNNIVKDKSIYYLLAELPIWFDVPFILNKPTTLIYHHMSDDWHKICYDFNLLSPLQYIYIKKIYTNHTL
jgi:hypothetical protein